KRGYKTLACENNHTFDIAKEGYSNLISGHKKSRYDKKLFIARRELNDSSNLYSILISKIIEIIKKYEIKTKNNVIDVGTGEGNRKSTRLNSSHVSISYAVFCL